MNTVNGWTKTVAIIAAGILGVIALWLLLELAIVVLGFLIELAIPVAIVFVIVKLVLDFVKEVSTQQ